MGVLATAPAPSSGDGFGCGDWPVDRCEALLEGAIDLSHWLAKKRAAEPRRAEAVINICKGREGTERLMVLWPCIQEIEMLTSSPP